MIPFVDLAAQQEHIRKALDKRISAVLAHGKYILGPEVFELEETLANYVGVKHCLSCASGTDALLIALMALNIGKGDEVITTAFTYVATGEVIARLGATPVFVDIDEKTYNIDSAKIEAAITERTKAIMPVSLYGQCADFDSINAIAKKYSLPVIEDGSQSFGATYKGRKSCGHSTIGCTSFFPAKPLGCYGDGGACFTNDDCLAKEMAIIRRHGQDIRYHHIRMGINSRLDTLQAAVLLAKMEIFDEEIKLRREVASMYNNKLNQYVMIPYVEPHNLSVYAYYVVQSDNREDLREMLQEAGIPTNIHYPIPLHKQPMFAYLENDYLLSNTEYAADRILSLPMHAWLDEREIERITDVIVESVRG